MSHTTITNELHEIYKAKNKDYGNAFSDTYKKLGIISATTRISDKTNRLISLSTKSQEEQKVKDETIKDTLMDLANYAIMTIMELEKDTSYADAMMGFANIKIDDEIELKELQKRAIDTFSGGVNHLD